MTNKKDIKFVVTSNEGHTEFSLVAGEALAKIKDINEKQGKWIYLDGTNVSASRLTEEMLYEAEDITLANIIVGGNCKEGLAVTYDLHVTPFEDEQGNSLVENTTENSAFVALLEYIPANAEELRVEPAVRLWVDQKHFVEVSHLRNLLFEGGLKKLTEFVQQEHSKFRATYNV